MLFQGVGAACAKVTEKKQGVELLVPQENAPQTLIHSSPQRDSSSLPQKLEESDVHMR